MESYGDDRDALNDFAKYFTNSHLSDITLLVGEEMLVKFKYQKMVLRIPHNFRISVSRLIDLFSAGLRMYSIGC